MKQKFIQKGQQSLSGWWSIVVLLGVVFAFLVADLFVYITECVIVQNTTAERSYIEIWADSGSNLAEEVVQESYLAKYGGKYLGELHTYNIPNWGSMRLADQEILKDYLGVEEFSVSPEQIAVVSDFDRKVGLGDKILKNMDDYAVVGESPETFIVGDENGDRLVEEIEDMYRQEYLDEYGAAGDEEVFVPKVQTLTTEVIQFESGQDAMRFIKSLEGVSAQDLFGGVAVVLYSDFGSVWRVIVLVEIVMLMATIVGVLIANARMRAK